MPDISYRVVESWLDDDTPCVCGSCDWQGPAKDLLEIESCALDPGDPSPAGRCPWPGCESLAYPDREKDREMESAREMREALEDTADWIKSLLDASMDEAADFITNNGEAVESKLRELLAKVKGGNNDA